MTSPLLRFFKTIGKYSFSSGPGRMPRSGSPVRLAMRTVGPISLAFIIAGCTTAPSWPTPRECSPFAAESVPGPSCTEPSNEKIALDFKAFLEAAVGDRTKLSDASALRRLNPADPRPAYRIGPLDEISISVWGAKEIWTEITVQSLEPIKVQSVQEDGTIVLPLLANTHVADLTLSDALAKIANQYRQVGGTSFQVDGQIVKFRSKPVQLDGAFHKPGTIYLSNEVRTLGEAISFGGGGFPEIAELSKGVLIRGQHRFRINYFDAQKGENDLENIELEPGDRVYFPSREDGFFYVMGEVMLPGSFPIPPRGINLIQAISQAKGPNVATADMTSIFLVRVNGEEPKVFKLTLEEIMASRDVAIAPGDRIYVSPTVLTNFDRTFRQIFPVLTPAIVLHNSFGVTLP